MEERKQDALVNRVTGKKFKRRNWKGKNDIKMAREHKNGLMAVKTLIITIKDKIKKEDKGKLGKN
jgi:hypothetical protein